jgi:tetratricopeptide (TPR) repeat protein/tRNA A-37 threonylcarbamoyl transferase component Bud32
MDTDRNLLFGVLALQAAYLDNNQFAEVCAAWTTRKETPLADLLVERGWLQPEERQEVERLVERHLKRHGGDVKKSLGAVADGNIRDMVRDQGDTDLRQSLSSLPPAAGYVLVTTTAQPGVQRLRYSITRLHGEGGLGKVFVAHDNDLQRDVALKELKPERSGHPEMWRRFLKEAQITGQLEHPNIVPVYELARRSEAEEAQPFYTMRLVRGQTLREAVRDYHQRKNEGVDPLALHRLLSAFINICQAIGYAHSRGVVHRDLKPENVVLGSFGEVVVLDWGLAKMVDGPDEASPAIAVSEDARTEATQTGRALGSPAYMAPEQAEGRMDLIDPRTDIYGLGGILFEILTGRPPHTGQDTAELLRQIVHGETPRTRRVDPTIPPALDAICAKAMAKNRGDRYGKAADLADEVQRYLADQPVSCYGEPWTVRAGRFARKHKVVVATAAAVLFTATIGLAAGLYFVSAEKNRTELARQGEETQRIAAENQAELARKNETDARDREAETRAALDFVENKILAAARPEGKKGGLGRTVSLRKAVEAALPFVEESFTSQPLIEARLRMTMGNSFIYLGDANLAEEQFRKAAATNTKYRGADHAETLRNLSGLATSYDALGKKADALKLREQTLATQKTKLAPDHPDTLMSMNNLALSYIAMNRPADAVKLQEETLVLMKGKLGPEHPDTLVSMHNLAVSYIHAGRPADALKVLEETFALQKAKLGADHPDTLTTMSNVSASYYNLGRHEEALKLMRETIKLQEVKLGPDHPETLANMGRVIANLVVLKRMGETVPIIDECVRRAAGKDVHPALIPGVMELRLSYFKQSKDAAGCRATAEMWEKLNRTDAASLYIAACMRAVTAAVLKQDPKTSVADATRLANEEADRAMAWLTKAAAAGYKDAANMKKDKDLDPLRDRDDFKKLLAELEPKK